MRVPLHYGLHHLDLEIAPDKLIVGARPADRGVSDPAQALRLALEAPFDYPPLRRALIPDDRVTVVVDEKLPGLADLLAVVLDYLRQAGIDPAAVTLLCPASPGRQPWLDDLPDAFQDAEVRIHDPKDRKELAYLDTTRDGRRIYLDRSLVDAGQVVVLTGRRYDPVLGYGGAEGALYPALADAEAITELQGRINLAVPGDAPWAVRTSALEAAWLLGAPFYVQIIAGSADGVADVITGATAASDEGRRRLDARWRQTIARPADLVLAGLSGDPSGHTFADLAAAAAVAARVVRPGGRIVLVTEASPELDSSFEVLTGADEPGELLDRWKRPRSLEQVPVFRWTTAASQARLSLVSGLRDELVEDLFATAVSVDALQRLVDAAESCLVLDDAHKALVVLGD